MLMLIIKSRNNRHSYNNFNTSHVNVNLRNGGGLTSNTEISIHLMLMLIHIQQLCHCCNYDFNTSHVNVNLNAQRKKAQRLLNFNTSHVNVNRQQFKR